MCVFYRWKSVGFAVGASGGVPFPRLDLGLALVSLLQIGYGESLVDRGH